MSLKVQQRRAIFENVQDVAFLLGRQVIGVLNDADRIPERLFRTLWLEATKEEASVAAWLRFGGQYEPSPLGSREDRSPLPECGDHQIATR